MLTEDYIVFHVDYIHGIIWIVFSQVLENLELHSCLIVVLLLILDHLNSNTILLLVVKALESYAK